MTKVNTNSKKGFTIIEVVLVLAIAGLIFLMVFVALPALQGSQRDTQRRNDLARVATAINQFQANNSGKLPADGSSFIEKYLKADGEGDFVDPTGEDYTIVFAEFDDKGEPSNTLKADVDPGFEITVFTHAKCNDEVAVKSANKRDYAIVYKLERSGVYCADNQ